MKNINLFLVILSAIFISQCTRNEKESKMSAPEPNRFSKQVINSSLTEPIALAISNAGDVFYCERRGKVFMYEPKKGTTSQIIDLLVDFYGGNGIMGMCLDPNFDYNKRIYLFYTDANALYKLSRFVLANGKADPKSEKLVFSIQLDKEPGAHNGGTIAFDSKGNLIISTGDNTPPWQANGYPPFDQRIGREIYDAQRTASNTHDLRGKIIRIKPLENGTYLIPDGNLFPKDGSKGKPEIYAMGCRNPWKMSIDLKNDFIYWGEVGPDAGTDSTIGPRGYDEINQAKAPGNFGWPYFVADNKPYRLVDLVNSTPGSFFDVNKPANNSKNNTGQKYLPKPINAFIYYPYAASAEFPEVGKGGRTACAGPFYDFTKHKSTVKFPSYYHDKFFIYDWMRDWIMAVTMDEKGNYVGMEPVMQNITFAHPIHMAFAPDGSLYMLEYGYVWYSQNTEARLSRVIFSEGNRPPVPIISIKDTIVSKNEKITFDAKKSQDFDGDSLSYEWYVNDSKSPIAIAKNFQLSFSVSGIYKIKLYVKDSKGALSSVTQKMIIGNTYPKIEFDFFGGNQNVFAENKELKYKVVITDKEDATIDKSKIKVSLNYMSGGSDIFPIMDQGHSSAPKERDISENKLIAASDCKSCHAMYKQSVGPSFIDIAKRYAFDNNAIETLALKIIKGGSGVWGGHAMSAHPQLSIADSKSMVEYILSLNNTDEGRYSKIIPNEGIIPAKEFNKSKGWFYLSATYTDGGADGAGTLTSQKIVELRNPTIECKDADSLFKAMTIMSKSAGIENYYAGAFNEKSYLIFKNFDFSAISSLAIRSNSKDLNGTLEFRVGSKNGKIVASVPIKAAGEWEKWSITETNVIPTKGKADLYITLSCGKNENNDMINLDWIKLNF